MTSSRNLAVWWIAANAAGWAASMGVFEALPNGFKPVACVLIGTAQWLVLRSPLRVSVWWMVGTSLAWFAGLQAGAPFYFFGPDPSWAGGVGGALAGVFQGWILWRRASKPMVWVPVSIVASVVGWWVGEYAGIQVNSHMSDSWSYSVGGAVGGIVIGMLSAPGLIWMARHPKTSNVPRPICQ